MNVSGEGERKQPPTIPKEAQVIVTILRDLGIQELFHLQFIYKKIFFKNFVG